MSRKIRLGVFETNSSSTHALTLPEGAVRDFGMIREALDSGVLTVTCDRDYGWGWERLRRPENKVAYLLAQMAGRDMEILSRQCLEPGHATQMLRADNGAVDELLSVMEEATGCRVLLDIRSDYLGVDHGSVGAHHGITTTRDRILDFVFSPDAHVELGNDNDPPPYLIPVDTGGTEEFYAKHYVQEPVEGEKMTLSFDTGYRDGPMLLEVPGRGLEISCHSGSFRLGCGHDGITITGIYVALHEPGKGGHHEWGVDRIKQEWADPEGRSRIATQILHEALSDLSDEGHGPRVLRAAPIAASALAPSGGDDRAGFYGWSRPKASLKLTAVATPEAIERLEDAFRSILDADRSPSP